MVNFGHVEGKMVRIRGSKSENLNCRDSQLSFRRLDYRAATRSHVSDFENRLNSRSRELSIVTPTVWCAYVGRRTIVPLPTGFRWQKWTGSETLEMRNVGLRISVSQWVKVDCHAVAVTGLTL